MTGTREHIAAEVRAELARQGKGRAYLVELLGLDPSALTARLRARRAFRAEELAAIADGLGVPATQFTDQARPVIRRPRRRSA